MLENVKNQMANVSAMLPEWFSDSLVTLLSAFLVLMSPMAVHGLDGPGRWKNYSWLGIVIVFAIVLLLVRYVKEENSSKKIRWSIVIPALFFVGSMFVSESLVPKVRPVYQGVSWCYLAYILLGMVMGHSDRFLEKFWDSFMRGIGMAFVLSALFCFAHRPVYEGTGYLGIYNNQNPFGIYSVLAVTAAIYNLNQMVCGKKGKKWMPYWIGVVVLATFFIIKSGSRASLLNVMILLLVWFLMIVREKTTWKERWIKVRRAASICGLLLVFTVLSYNLLTDLLETLPTMVNHPITTENDTNSYKSQMDKFGKGPEIRETQTDEEELIIRTMSVSGVHADDDDVSAMDRIIETIKKKGIKAILGLRGTIYRYGITHMNWQGHENGSYRDEEMNRTHAHMHNNAIQYGYVYGYACFAGYLILVLAQMVVCLKRDHYVSLQGTAWMWIFVMYTLVYLFETGATVVRDVALIPYLLVVGQMMWKTKIERHQSHNERK